MNTDAKLLKVTFLGVLKDSDPALRVNSVFKLQNDVLEFDGNLVKLSDFEKIYVFGAGKAAGRVALGLNNLFGEKITCGCVISTVETPDAYGNIQILPGDHPLPGINSLSSSKVLINQLQEVSHRDLVLFITTGGASSMFCVPEDGLDWQELRSKTNDLLRSGKDIYEMNRIRSQWDKVKSGKTLSFAKPKRWINLLISDVPGDDPTVIGSGPAIATKSTPKPWIPENLETVFLDRPSRFAGTLGAHINAKRPECGLYVYEKAYAVDIVSVAEMIVNELQFQLSGNQKGQSFVSVYHGESTVKVSGEGIGGRNHHLGLLLLAQLNELLPNTADFAILSAGTDGMDGNTDSAGIVCDRKSFQELVKKKANPQDYLSSFDSGSFFMGSDCVIKTGPTGTNLMDVQVVLLRK